MQFVAAFTTKSKEKMVIPINWVKSFNPTDFINHGIDQENDFVVFYSANRNDIADFNLPMKEKIDGRGCCGEIFQNIRFVYVSIRFNIVLMLYVFHSQ